MQVVSAFAVFERIFDYLDMKAEGGAQQNGKELETISGAVQFEHVSFAYSSDRQALTDISTED